MDNLAVHFERLRRHYDASVHTYDAISLLDLSHTLRIWADLKNAMHAEVPAFASSISFKTGVPAKKVRKAARRHRHVFAFMPGGVVTHASQGHLFGSTEEADKNADFLCSAWFKRNSDGSAELKNFCFIAAAVGDEIVRASAAEEVTRCDYIQWLGAEAVRIGYVNDSGQLEHLAISREQVIRRMANAFDGSHPSVGESLSTNRFDAPIRKLLFYHFGGLPLPYFILLKTAQDILTLAPRALKEKR